MEADILVVEPWGNEDGVAIVRCVDAILDGRAVLGDLYDPCVETDRWDQ